MSIITKRGDSGETDLIFGKRISKTSDRIGALGSLDELNAALGLARAAGTTEDNVLIIDRVQNLLFGLMGELACLPEDLETYREKEYAMLGEDDLNWLVGKAMEVEKAGVRFTHWAVPGAEGSMARAHLDFARTMARRAERAVLLMHQSGEEVREVIRLFLNRLSDTLWLLARSGTVAEA